MKKLLTFTACLALMAFISVHSMAQKTPLTEKLSITPPKSDYFEPAIKNFSLLNNLKSELKLTTKDRFSSLHPSQLPATSRGKIIPLETLQAILEGTSIAPSPMSNIDNMTIATPNPTIKYPIISYNPAATPGYYAENMPNAFRKK